MTRNIPNILCLDKQASSLIYLGTEEMLHTLANQYNIDFMSKNVFEYIDTMSNMSPFAKLSHSDQRRITRDKKV